MSLSSTSASLIYLKYSIIFLALVGSCVFTAGNASAAEADRFSGWAWSENIGWISFNCTNTNTCGDVDYGVTSSGEGAVQPMSGWAWSPNVGWIDFSHASLVAANRSIIGQAVVHSTVAEPYCASTDDYQTNASNIINISGGTYTCTNDVEDDGWDGIIDLEASIGISYGPIADSFDNTADGWDWPDDQFYLMDGFSWGDEVVGWISFSCQTTNTCGSVGYGVFMDPFFFEFTADQGIDINDKVDYEGAFTHIWTLQPDAEIVSCTGSAGPGTWSDNPTKSTSPSPLSQLVSNATSTATSTLSCTNIDNKTLTRNTLIYVKSPPPTLTFTARDYNIGYNSQAELDWVSNNIADCTASAGDIPWDGPVATGTGTYLSTPLTVDTTFNLLCNSSYPIDYPTPILGTLEVTIQRLIMDFYAEDNEGNRLISGDLFAYTEKDNINLVWETEFATQGCVASGDWSGTKVTADPNNDIVDGTELATIPTGGTYTYVLTCNGELGQQLNQTVTIRVTNNPDFTEDISSQ